MKPRLNRLLPSICLIVACSKVSLDTTSFDSSVNGVVLNSFYDALVREGPVNEKVWFVDRTLDPGELDTAAIKVNLRKEYPSFDTTSLGSLLRELHRPRSASIPPSAREKFEIVSDSAAKLRNDSIAMSGRMILRLSPVGYNVSRTRAVVMTDVVCGPDCGVSQLIFLSGYKQRWIPIKHVRILLPK